MTRPPHDPEQAILSRSFVARVEFYAALITGVTLGGFVWALSGDPADVPRAMTIAFVMLALAQTFHLVSEAATPRSAGSASSAIAGLLVPRYSRSRFSSPPCTLSRWRLYLALPRSPHATG